MSDLATRIIEAHRTGGIDVDLVMQSWAVPDPVRFGEILYRMSPPAFDELHLLRQTYRPETAADRETARLNQQADPTNIPLDQWNEQYPDGAAAIAALYTATTSEWDDDPDGGWPTATRQDIQAVLEGTWEPPTPTILQRNDGKALLYPGKVHSLSGEPGSGKTWIAICALAETLADGGTAAYLDHEDRLDTAIRRLRALGCPDTAILERFTYITPTYAIKGGGIPTGTITQIAGCQLVVIDSLGEALAHSQLSQNDDGEVAGYMDKVARRLADGGAAVLLLDHVTKDKEGRGRWAIGSQRKLAAIDGAAYMAVTIKALSRDTEGTYKVTCSKDRGGNYQHGSTVAICQFDVDGDTLVATIAPDTATEGDQFLPTHLMQEVSKYLEMQMEPATQADVVANVEGRATYVKDALSHLITAGYVTKSRGPRGSMLHTSERSYREGDPTTRPVDNPPKSSQNPPRPTSSHLVPDEVRSPSERPRPSSPPFRGDEDEVGGSENTQTTETVDLVPDEVNTPGDHVELDI